MRTFCAGFIPFRIHFICFFYFLTVIPFLCLSVKIFFVQKRKKSRRYLSLTWIFKIEVNLCFQSSSPAIILFLSRFKLTLNPPLQSKTPFLTVILFVSRFLGTTKNTWNEWNPWWCHKAQVRSLISSCCDWLIPKLGLRLTHPSFLLLHFITMQSRIFQPALKTHTCTSAVYSAASLVIIQFSKRYHKIMLLMQCNVN